MDSELNGFSRYRQPNGMIIMTDRVTGVETKLYTAQCVHCGMFWQVLPGSGKTRGFCLKCPGLTCGARQCQINCVNVEKMLERIEEYGRRILRGDEQVEMKNGIYLIK